MKESEYTPIELCSASFIKYSYKMHRIYTVYVYVVYHALKTCRGK